MNSRANWRQKRQTNEKLGILVENVPRDYTKPVREIGRNMKKARIWQGRRIQTWYMCNSNYHHILPCQNRIHCTASTFASLWSWSEQGGPIWYSWRMWFIVWISPYGRLGLVLSPFLKAVLFFFPGFDLALFKVTHSLLLGLKPIGRVSSKLGRASLPASTLL